jgi:hypothetical protein
VSDVQQIWRWQRTVASAMPLFVSFVLWFSLPFVISTGSGAVTSLWLATSLGVLALAGWWMCRELMLPGPVRKAGLAGLAATCIGWAWQFAAYRMLVPGRLPYGYFQSAPGQGLRLRLLELPYGTIMAVLATTLCVGLVMSWRNGARWVLLSVAMWWFVLFVTFSWPSVYLSIQGDGSVFI